MKILVTGAAGFIGSHLSRALLAEGHDVVGFDNFDPFYPRAAKELNLRGLDAARFRLVEADLRDRAAVERAFAETRPELAYHLAALAGVRPSIERPLDYVQVNVDGLLHVLESARAHDCRDVVFASSSSVYGNRSHVPFAETDDCGEPISPYAATKRAGELLCHAHAHLFGLRIASLRFFTVYGPSQRPDLAIAKFMSLIASGAPVPMFGDGSTSRDYTYIDDIVAGVRAAGAAVRAAAPGFHRIFNLGGSEPVALADMIARIGAVLGRTPVVERHPMQPGDVERTFADLSRSRAELGFAPRTSFDEGLRRQAQAAGFLPS